MYYINSSIHNVCCILLYQDAEDCNYHFKVPSWRSYNCSVDVVYKYRGQPDSPPVVMPKVSEYCSISYGKLTLYYITNCYIN